MVNCYLSPSSLPAAFLLHRGCADSPLSSQNVGTPFKLPSLLHLASQPMMPRILANWIQPTQGKMCSSPPASSPKSSTFGTIANFPHNVPGLNLGVFTTFRTPFQTLAFNSWDSRPPLYLPRSLFDPTSTSLLPLTSITLFLASIQGRGLIRATSHHRVCPLLRHQRPRFYSSTESCHIPTMPHCKPSASLPAHPPTSFFEKCS